MPRPVHSLHHFHTRKRIYKEMEPYPTHEKFKRFMDEAIYVIGMLGPIMTIPQILKIWVEKNVAGISIITWESYLLGNIFWLMYGFLHKEKPIIVIHILSIIMNAAVVLGVLFYR